MSQFEIYYKFAFCLYKRYIFVKHDWNIFDRFPEIHPLFIIMESTISNNLTPNSDWSFYIPENGQFLAIIIYNVQTSAIVRKWDYIKLNHLSLTKRTYK